MLSTRQSLFWMTIYLAIVAAVCFLLFGPLHGAFMANWGFNAVILGVLGVGILIDFRQVLVLNTEIRWIRGFRTGQTDPQGRGTAVGTTDHHGRARAHEPATEENEACERHDPRDAECDRDDQTDRAGVFAGRTGRQHQLHEGKDGGDRGGGERIAGGCHQRRRAA